MDNLKKGIITLIKSAITGEKYDLPKDFDLKNALIVAKKHNIMPLVYNGAYNCGYDNSQESMLTAFQIACNNFAVHEMQMYELLAIQEQFEKHQISHMVLKGSRLKTNCYPNPELRNMSDIDVLIKLEQYQTIRQVMKNLGYSEGPESDHELIWRKGNNILVELHKRIIPSYNKDYYAYFGDGWQLATQKTQGKDFAYEMSNNDEFIYLFTHLCKHYRDSGIGLKHLLDIWVYQIKNKDLDWQYIENEFKKLKIYDFYQNVQKTLRVCFDGEDGNQVTEYIIEAVFNGGAFNVSKARVLSSTLKQVYQGKSVTRIKIERVFKKAFISTFVPYRDMCDIYPVLKKLPILLPFMWIWHFFRRLFTKGKLKDYNKEFKDMKEDNVKAYKQSLNFVGLDYNFDGKENFKSD